MSPSSGFAGSRFSILIGRLADVIPFHAALICTSILLGAFLTGCGGGSSNSGGGGGTGVTPPSNLVYSQTVINAAQQFPMTPVTPTVKGTVTSYTVAPALPAGMALNATTGVISGTPTTVAAQANYTITASNTGGSTTAVLQISVALTAPDKLVYPQATINATTGVAIQPDVPTIEGVVTGYSVNPGLPPGLLLSTTTGQITGTPTAATAQATYVITAANSIGNTTASVQITVSLAAPTTLAYPQTVINATTGTAISPDVPSVTGLVTGYTVSPALPAGLILNVTTGAISGTPTAASAMATYTVTASNSAGSTTASLQITVTLSAPSNLVYPQTTISANVGTAITTDTPTVKGTITGYTVSPALPSGLTLNTSTGAISGTPTATSATATYTVTASNSAGSTTASLQITVTQQGTLSNLLYPQATIVATVGIAIVKDIPTVNGTPTGYSVSPALPAGLTLNTSSGVITGTPTTAAAMAEYTVTAQNASGTTAAQLTITVAAGPLNLYQPDLAAVESLHSNNDRVLATGAGNWLLWDFSGAVVAKGNSLMAGDLEGQIFAIQDNAGNVQVRSSVDGSPIFTVSGVLAFHMPADGSYICTVSSTQLTIWSPSGTSEVVRSGDYSQATIFAATGQLQVAQGPAGQSVIETIDVASGTSTASPSFLGTFKFWFADGSHFVTTFGVEYWVYSNTGVQEASGTYPQYVTSWQGGVGNWIWTSNSSGIGNFAVFTIGATTPTKTFNIFESPLVSQGTEVVGFGARTTEVTVIDLSGSSPTLTNYTLPVSEYRPAAYTKNANGERAVGNLLGVVMDFTNLSSPVVFDYGQVTGIAAGGSTAAVGTASGKVLLYDITNAQQTGTIDLLTSKMQMSSDGTVLAALGITAYDILGNGTADQLFNVYSLPSLTTIQSQPYPAGPTAPIMIEFSLSASGTTLGQTFSVPSTSGLQQVTGVSGLPLIWSRTGETGVVYLSPDGTLIGALQGIGGILQDTAILQNGTSLRVADGSVGFIDNDNLLVETAETISGESIFNGDAIYNVSSGTITRTFPVDTIPDILDYNIGPLTLTRPQFPSSNAVYWAVTGVMYSLNDGSVIWQGPALASNSTAFAGSYFVYQNGQTETVQVVPVSVN